MNLNTFKHGFSDAGTIRNILYILALITIIFKPENNAIMDLDGLQFIPTLVLPVIAPLLISGFFLDMVMCRIYSSEQTDEVKSKFRFISRTDLFFALLLLILWVPYMLEIN